MSEHFAKNENILPELNPKPETEFGLSRENIDAVFNNKNYEPKKLINLLESKFPKEYSSDVGVWEGYTLKEHTLMVMQQFEKYFGEQELPGNVDKNIFRFFLALHDIGKPEAVKNGKKEEQGIFSKKNY